MTKLSKSQIAQIKALNLQSYIYGEVTKLGYTKSRQTFNNCINRKKIGKKTREFTPEEEEQILEVLGNIVNGLSQ